MTGREQDPWGDLTWSDGEAAPPAEVPAAPSSESSAESSSEPTSAQSASTAAAPAEPPACPWCATPAAEGAMRCAACGAALAQRESIGDLVVPGLTAVDPALKDLDGRPLKLRGPSPTQGVASGLVVAAAAGGPIGLAIIGGVGAVAAAEYMGAGGDGGKGHERVGETSEAVLLAIDRLDRGETLPSAADPTPRPDAAPTDTAGAKSAEEDMIDGRG